MADYYPLILKAVDGLDKNTGEARRALYERARQALVAQLRGVAPALSESEITRERLALEESIRKVEAEAARRLRPTPTVKPPEPRGELQRRVLDDLAAEVRQATSEPDEDRHQDVSRDPPRPDYSHNDPPPRTEPPRAEPPPTPRPPRPPVAETPPPVRKPPRPRLSEEGLRGFRDVIAEADGLGQKTAQGSRAARETYAAAPSQAPDLDRLEPRVEPEGLRTPVREPPAPRNYDSPAPRNYDSPPSRNYEAPPPRNYDPPPSRKADVRPPQQNFPSAASDVLRPRRSYKGVIAAFLSIVLLAGVAGGLYLWSDNLKALLGTVRNFAPALQQDATPQKPKIPDRVGQDGQPPVRAPDPQPGGQGGAQAVAPVAQRVVLYEEDPSDSAGKRFVGSAVWRTEKLTGANAGELAIRCDVEISERRMGMTMSLRRNTDQALPASHTIEIQFNLPADFPFGGINNVPGILMKQAEQTRGAPISGLAVKVTSGFFLIGLSAVDAEMQRNVELLKERAWFDIPIIYNNGRRAIMAVEKGTPGERVFNEAFAAWGQ